MAGNSQNTPGLTIEALNGSGAELPERRGGRGHALTVEKNPALKGVEDGIALAHLHEAVLREDAPRDDRADDHAEGEGDTAAQRRPAARPRAQAVGVKVVVVVASVACGRGERRTTT